MRARLALGTFAVLALSSGCARTTEATEPLTLGAAASLRPVLPALIAAFAFAFDGGAVVATYGSSGDLRNQVAAGAPIDVVLFAHPLPLQALLAAGHADSDSQLVFATNRLVLVGQRGATRVTLQTLSSLPASERVAIGDPASVPAGHHAKAALLAAGSLDALQTRLVLAGDVGQVLGYARRGEVAAAFVYATDAANVPEVEVFEEVPAALTGRIELVAAATVRGRSAHPEFARAFVAFLGSERARAVLAEKGFGPP